MVSCLFTFSHLFTFPNKLLSEYKIKCKGSRFECINNLKAFSSLSNPNNLTGLFKPSVNTFPYKWSNPEILQLGDSPDSSGSGSGKTLESSQLYTKKASRGQNTSWVKCQISPDCSKTWDICRGMRARVDVTKEAHPATNQPHNHYANGRKLGVLWFSMVARVVASNALEPLPWEKKCFLF